MRRWVMWGAAAVVLCVTVLLVLGATGKIDFFRTEDRMRIVSLSPSSTEILYAVGAGADVVAVDRYSNYPGEAGKVLDEKLAGSSPEVEDVMKYRPDLVIVPGYEGSGGRGIAPELKDRGVEVLIDSAPRNLDGAYDAIQQIGDTVDRSDRAREIVVSMKSEIGNIVRGTPKQPKEVSYYHEVDSNYISLTSRTFAGSVYSLFGLRSIADQYEDTGKGYPDLEESHIVAANPEVIFLAGGQTLKTVQARDGWGGITAVRERRVVALDADLCSRWGPRLVEFVREISRILDNRS